MTRRLIQCAIVTILVGVDVLSSQACAADRYPQWRHSGVSTILTTPEGANLPKGTSVEDFPVLLRLHRDWFDFSQAKPGGEDIRFSSVTGEPLAYQIENWNSDVGTASVWVRIPRIEGDSRQEIRLHWGNADAESESNGAAVFGEFNGFLSVWHMTEPVKDEVGTLQSQDVDTTSAAGPVGPARHLGGRQGIFCGDKIPNYPTGCSPHSSEAWLRPELPNTTILGWGKEQAQGKVVMSYRSPPHVGMECYFSDGNVQGDTPIPLGEWVHVFHTYQQGDSRLYVNGVLDEAVESRATPLNIQTPARLWIGGWYNNYTFVGDIDEVRVSKVARSPEWIKLQYENQKPMQTLVGPIVQPGNVFEVTPSKLAVSEGNQVPFSARADGAQKIYWILQRGQKETVAAVDRLHFAFDAGRVNGDDSAVLVLKAIYPDEVKTIDVPIDIKESIPEPVFSLTAPAQWDGRTTTEIVPNIENLEAMQTAGRGELNYAWQVSSIAVLKDTAQGKLMLNRAQNSGRMTVTATIDNGGRPITREVTVTVTEPTKDPWVRRTPGGDEKPVNNQFYARDDNNEGTLYCNGQLEQDALSLFLNLYSDNELTTTLTQKPMDDGAYAFMVKLKPGLIKYRIELGCKRQGSEAILHTADNIVCGDAYIIDGQSNALATDTGEESPRMSSDWIRSYGYPRDFREGESENLWCNPVWKFERGENYAASCSEHKAQLGWWGMELAKHLVESQKVPICIINGAVGGTRIDQHQRNPENPEDRSTIYGRLLWRVRQARLTHGIRAVLWHQGENDQGAAGPDGGYGWETYQQYFIDMSAAWKEDFPNIQHYYVFQIWPNSCSMGGGRGDMLRERQRTLPMLYSNMSIMSTLGIKPPGPCHYPLEGWSQFAHLVQPLIERDFYGRKTTEPIDAPNLQQAYYTSKARDAIALRFDQPVVWNDSLVEEFYLDDLGGKVESGIVSDNVLTLTLKENCTAETITYLKETSWSQDRLLWGKNGIAALTFCKVPIAEKEGTK